MPILVDIGLLIGSRQRSLHVKLRWQELQQPFLPIAVTVGANQSEAPHSPISEFDWFPPTVTAIGRNGCCSSCQRNFMCSDRWREPIRNSLSPQIVIWLVPANGYRNWQERLLQFLTTQLYVQRPLARTNQKLPIPSNPHLIGSRQRLLQLAGTVAAVPEFINVRFV